MFRNVLEITGKFPGHSGNSQDIVGSSAKNLRNVWEHSGTFRDISGTFPIIFPEIFQWGDFLFRLV